MSTSCQHVSVNLLIQLGLGTSLYLPPAGGAGGGGAAGRTSGGTGSIRSPWNWFE